MGPATGRPVCNPVQPQTSQVCVTSTGSDSLGSSLSWENLDAYAFPPVSLLNQVISKVADQGCRRMILIAPGWPNMTWFWNLVNLLVQTPFRLPLQRDLVTQSFNGLVHKNLNNLNLHAWLLEPLSFRSKGSLTKWQQELSLLRDTQPEPFKKQSGPVLSNGGLQVALCKSDCGLSLASFQRQKSAAKHY